MGPLRFLIIGPRSSGNTQDLVEAIAADGHSSTVCALKDLLLRASANSEFEIFLSGVPLTEFDIVILRAFNKHPSLGRLVSRFLLDHGKTFIDEGVWQNDLDDKLFQAYAFSTNCLAHPLTFHAAEATNLAEIIERLSFPFIAKPLNGEQGRGVALLENMSQVDSYLEENGTEVLFQQYIPLTYDVRVFVVNKKIIGCIKRHRAANDFRSNASLGAEVEEYDAPAATQALALAAVRALQYEVAGVDIIETATGPLVLEVNHTPQWQGLKKATGINPAQSIVAFSLEKYSASPRK